MKKMLKQFILLSYVLFFSFYLSGCGQSGPLYLPPAPTPIAIPAPTPCVTNEIVNETVDEAVIDVAE